MKKEKTKKKRGPIRFVFGVLRLLLVVGLLIVLIGGRFVPSAV